MLLTEPKPRERGPNVEPSAGLAEGTETDKSEDASGRTHLQ